MRKTRVRLLVGVVLVLALALAVGTAMAGKKPPSGGGGGGKACPDVWDPVTCADGVTYSNQGYADLAKAPRPCSPAGGGPVEAE
jgi:hypothetical protein